ncbi:SMP-30/gluconolactonase/LRE family protein [Terricaulis sp.]|uniref:SMP-30/gluconolactonase/LRE family protein n=1 Tax=Terricaulis sp. TaxID=2768686 RepID=UPI003783FC4D
MRLASFLVAAIALVACAGHAPAQEGQAVRASYPEGPLWVGSRLYYAEMGADRISTWENGQSGVFFRQQGCGPTAIAPYGEGFLVLCHIGHRVVAVDARGQELRRWDRDDTGELLMDPNDGYADGRGGVYFSDPGVFSRETRPHGKVMYLTAEGRLRQVARPLWYPNGIFVDRAHNKLYVDEHMSAHVLVYDIQANGDIDGPEVFADLSDVRRPRRYDTPYAETGPDGLEMAANGDLYVAVYGEGRILRFSPEGRLLGMLDAPARYLTNIAFNAEGGAATTGSFDNDTPPFPGEVRIYSASDLTDAVR